MVMRLWQRAIVVGVVTLSFPAMARNKKQKGRSVVSINAAIMQSQEDHNQLRRKFEEQVDERLDELNAYEERSKPLTIQASSYEPAAKAIRQYNDDDFGDDLSGLGTLTSPVQEESIDIDFDQELSEINSIKD